MSIVPGDCGFVSRRSHAFDPLSYDLSGHFIGFPFGSDPALSSLLFVPRPSFPTPFIGRSSVLLGVGVDWKETPGAHVFKADLPGFKKEDVKVEVEDGRVLQISGERKADKEEKTDTWYHVERSSGQFLRRFQLPENAKVDQVKAAMENGVLTVTVPKEEVKRADPKVIEISV
ncbi:hypothetical protein Cni_G15699 [Canna indica]|uniref:SHSP domain-containing protein n=1 Tax=Canna indica TaxID=4628 RepID=A0AAQ3KEU4_9LILI|nr:hypothetical protein Cni_G15699 [Canna indica]